MPWNHVAIPEEVLSDVARQPGIGEVAGALQPFVGGALQRLEARAVLGLVSVVHTAERHHVLASRKDLTQAVLTLKVLGGA